jgi:hypothetical protein
MVLARDFQRNFIPEDGVRTCTLLCHSGYIQLPISSSVESISDETLVQLVTIDEMRVGTGGRWPLSKE